MLELLHIENIAIIEHCELTFDRGFTVLTGETGAGKSIVIDAINAVLGQRTSRELIRTGAGKAYVSALFSGIGADALCDLGAAPDEEGNLLLEREILADGKNLCRIAGRPATVGQLRALGSRLLNIHGQHDGQQLLEEEQHIVFLDLFGKTENAKKEYADKYNALSECDRQIAALQMDEAEKARRMDTLSYQIKELEKARLQPGEEEELTARRNLMRNGEKLIAALSEADYALNGDEAAQGAVALIRQAQGALQGIRRIDESYEALWQRLEDACSEVYDIADTVATQRDELDFSPRELDAIEERLDQLYRLKKKYGPTVEEMLDYLKRCQEELASITEADDTLALLTRQREALEKAAREAARELSAQRHAAAERMEAQILSELAQLDMGRIRFTVAFTEKPLDAGGMDAVRFLMSANAGEELRPLQKIASGGELARIMLAMKNVLSEQDRVPTLVFDEVDTGVSGRAAQKVAEKMAQISRRKQVLCVTHLPQIAAMADNHFSVEKAERGGRTYTQVTALDRPARCRELARLTGGDLLSDAILKGADELLTQAEGFRAGI